MSFTITFTQRYSLKFNLQLHFMCWTDFMKWRCPFMLLMHRSIEYYYHPLCTVPVHNYARNIKVNVDSMLTIEQWFYSEVESTLHDSTLFQVSTSSIILNHYAKLHQLVRKPNFNVDATSCANWELSRNINISDKVSLKNVND